MASRTPLAWYSAITDWSVFGASDAQTAPLARVHGRVASSGSLGGKGVGR